MSGDEPAGDAPAPEDPLLIEPVVAWPREAGPGRDYLVTVDLRGPLPAPDGTPAAWPYPDEEFTFTVTLDGSPSFVCTALGEPSLVLHRFGGTYGPARFRVTAGTETGPASLWLTVSNQWGVPVRKAELPSRITESTETGRRAAALEETRDAAPAEETPAPPAVRPPAGRPERRPRRIAPDASRPRPGEPPREPMRGPQDRPRRPERIPPVRPAPETAAGRQTVTVSFAGFNRAWAAWIGDRLERRGLRVSYLRWDAPPEVPLTDLLHDLLLAPGPVLLVLSEWYFQMGARTAEEWNGALREVVAAHRARFAAVSITRSPLPTATAVLAAVELTDIDAEEAERRLLARLELPYEPLREPRDLARPGPRFPAAMPDVWGGVPRRNTRFTGRETLLGEAYHLLQRAGSGAGVLTLYGMSGVGKTQLAAEYVYRFGSEYDVVWWVNAGSRATFRRQLAELAPELGLRTGQEYGERLRAVRDALRRGEPHARWLLVLDGADEPDQIWDLVPAGPGHCVITSRNPEWGEHNSMLLEVGVYERDESVAFIRRRAPRLTDAEADQLAEALQDLPLLLDQTAGWLSDSALSVEEYIALLDDGIDDTVVQVSADFPLAFRTAWSILLTKLSESVPESVALLRLCTFFSPGLIPVHLLRSLPPDEALPPSVGEVLSDPLLWNRAINQLRQYSVVRVELRDVDSSNETLYLHRMVHQIVHQEIPDEERQALREIVRQTLAAADPRRPADPELWPAYAEIVPHLKYADVLTSDRPAVQNLVLNCLRYLYLSGEYGAGIRLGNRAMDIWRELLGESHPRIWELTHHYANLLRAVGDYPRTYAIEREAAEHLRRQRGERDLDHLRALGGLAADLRGLARYDEALEMSQRVLTRYRELLGDQDTRTLNAQNNLAVSLRLLGRYDEALDVDRGTLEARRELLHARHPLSLDSEISYAIDLRLLGRYPEAASVQGRNVRENQRVMGADNPQTLRAEHNLALCRRGSGETAGARTRLAWVLERGERVLGETDPLTLTFASSQSCFLREWGELDQARDLSERVALAYETMLGPGHPYAVGARANEALVLRSVGERDQARVLGEMALAGMTRALGDDHPWTLGCALNASALSSLTGDVEAALVLSRATLSRAVRSLGSAHHPLVLAARISLAADLRALRQRAEADQEESEALALLDGVFGRDHPRTVEARARNRPYWDFEPQTT